MSYLLFSGNDYYPVGGADDLKGRYDTIEEAMAAHDPQRFKYNRAWAHIMSLDTLQLVKYYSRGSWFEYDKRYY